MSFPRVKLERFLHHRADFVEIDDTETYKRLRVQLHGRGIVLRDEVDGSQIKTKKQQVVHAGDFVVAEIDAKVGGFGIAPDEVAGGIVSSHYFLFDIDESVCLKGWLGAAIRSGRLEEQVSARGSTNYAAIRPESVLNLEIPLLPLTEQRRLVTRLGQISSRALEISRLSAEVAAALTRLPALLAHRPDLSRAEKEIRGWVERPAAELLSESRSFQTVDRLKTYPNLGIYSFGRGLFEKPPIDGARTSARQLNRVRAGQFIYSRLFAFEGAYGVVPPALDDYFVSNEYPTFDCDPDLALPEFLRAYFASSSVWREVSAGSQGLGDRRQRVQPEILLAYRLLVPPLSEQRRIRDLTPSVQSALRLVNACRSQNEEVPAALINQFLKEGDGCPG